MTDDLVFEIPIPLSINQTYKLGIKQVYSRQHKRMVDTPFMYLSDRARLHKRTVYLLALSAANEQGFEVKEGEYIGWRLDIYPPDRRRRDLDGGIKTTQDAIAEALGFDDTRIEDLAVHKQRQPDKANPRAVVYVWKVK